jgi:methyl-accepting chemotaxis protein
MSKEIIDQLTSWAESHHGERAAFAKVLASEMTSKSRMGTLGLIDVRREFEARTETNLWIKNKKFQSILLTLRRHLGKIRPVVLAMYLLPIAFTWFELSRVIDAFVGFSKNPSAEENANLISFWAGAYNNAYAGSHLQEVGVKIAVFIFILVALQLIIDSLTQEHSEISPELNSLIFNVQLELAKSRSLTPQEFTEAISSAAESLEIALTTITTVVEEASSMIGNISQATDGLTTASLTIQTVSGRLEGALAPIVNLESSLSNANSTIQSSTHAMAEMRNSMTAALSSLSAFSDGTDIIGKTSVAVEAASTRLMVQVAAAGNALGATDDRLSRALISASEIADRLANVASSTETHEPHLATMARIAQSLSDTAHSIHITVQEVKAATSTFEQLNREIADALRAN